MYTLRHVLDTELAPFKPITVEDETDLPRRGDSVEVDLKSYSVVRVVHRVILEDVKWYARAGQAIVYVANEGG